MTIRVAGLFGYPVKSLQGEPRAEAEVERRGLAGDRRWMVIDPAGRFLTRREVPDMALIAARADGGGIILHHARMGACAVAVPGPDAPRIEAVVWRDRLTVRGGNAAADAFLSDALGRPVRLVHQADDAIRPVAPKWALDGDHVSLADGFPLLVTNLESLAALNARLEAPVAMARFRANIVLDGAAAWAEDGWRTIRIGEVALRVGPRCARCVIVTQQVATGERRDGNEPLTTLRRMGRVTQHGVMFGVNAIPETPGTIRVGDAVTVVEGGTLA